MDKALVSGAKDCGFESHLGWVMSELFLVLFFFFYYLRYVREKKIIKTNKKEVFIQKH